MYNQHFEESEFQTGYLWQYYAVLCAQQSAFVCKCIKYNTFYRKSRIIIIITLHTWEKTAFDIRNEAVKNEGDPPNTIPFSCPL